ncbi:MAG: phosphate acyltransferase, partial [Pseudomonadota bacterium]
IIGLAPGVREFSALSMVIVSKGVYFLCDTQVCPDPTADQVAEMAIMAAEHVKRFGLTPKIALLSHADFGSYDTASARKMREELTIIMERRPDLEADGEMQADTALSPTIRDLKLSGSRLTGEANVLVMPSLDAANIAYQLTKMLADALPVGPILIGGAKPAHILTRSVTARGVVNMTAVAVAEAQV